MDELDIGYAPHKFSEGSFVAEQFTLYLKKHNTPEFPVKLEEIKKVENRRAAPAKLPN